MTGCDTWVPVSSVAQQACKIFLFLFSVPISGLPGVPIFCDTLGFSPVSVRVYSCVHIKAIIAAEIVLISFTDASLHNLRLPQCRANPPFAEWKHHMLTDNIEDGAPLRPVDAAALSDVSGASSALDALGALDAAGAGQCCRSRCSVRLAGPSERSAASVSV